MIHIDTHVVVWLYEGKIERLPASARNWLTGRRPLVSPMVRLELAFLNEIGRVRVPAAEILDSLAGFAGLRAAESDFVRVSQIAAGLVWTRDPFDRMIAAHALADDLPLLTADTTMRANCAVARWEG
jgi:PIN domain nuclease of toxin-antitoxin system